MLEDVLKLELKNIGLPKALFENIRSRLWHYTTLWDKAFTVQDLVDAGISEIIRTRNFGPKSLEILLTKMQELGVPFTITAAEYEAWSEWNKKEYGEVLNRFGAIVEPGAQLKMVSLDSLHQTLPEKMNIEDFDIALLTKFGMVALKSLPAECFKTGSAPMKKIEGLKLKYVQILAQGLAEVTAENFPNLPASVLDKKLQERCNTMYNEQCAYASIVAQKRGELAKPEATGAVRQDGAAGQGGTEQGASGNKSVKTLND